MMWNRGSRASRRGALLFTAYLGTQSSLAFADEVRLLEATTMDWPEGRLSIEAELSAAGHHVTSAPSAALDPEALLAELVAEEASGYSASATVVRIGRSGIAYVSFRGSKDIFRVTSSDADPTRAAHLLSLRVAELIALRDRDHEPEAPLPPPPKAPSPPLPPPPKRQPYSRPEWELDGGAGASFSAGLSEPSLELKGGLGRRFGSWFALDARGTWGLVPGRRSFPEGALQVQSRSLGLGAFARLEELLPARDGIPGRVGPRAGTRALVECFEITGRSEEETLTTTACSIALALSLRVDFRLTDHFSLWLATEGSFALTPVRVLASSTPLATLGQPKGGLDAGVAWQF